jgi:hypothetical protein
MTQGVIFGKKLGAVLAVDDERQVEGVVLERRALVAERQILGEGLEDGTRDGHEAARDVVDGDGRRGGRVPEREVVAAIQLQGAGRDAARPTTGHVDAADDRLLLDGLGRDRQDVLGAEGDVAVDADEHVGPRAEQEVGRRPPTAPLDQRVPDRRPPEEAGSGEQVEQAEDVGRVERPPGDRGDVRLHD